ATVWEEPRQRSGGGHRRHIPSLVERYGRRYAKQHAVEQQCPALAAAAISTLAAGTGECPWPGNRRRGTLGDRGPHRGCGVSGSIRHGMLVRPGGRTGAGWRRQSVYTSGGVIRYSVGACTRT